MRTHASTHAYTYTHHPENLVNLELNCGPLFFSDIQTYLETVFITFLVNYERKYYTCVIQLLNHALKYLCNTPQKHILTISLKVTPKRAIWVSGCRGFWLLLGSLEKQIQGWQCELLRCSDEFFFPLFFWRFYLFLFYVKECLPECMSVYSTCM